MAEDNIPKETDIEAIVTRSLDQWAQRNRQEEEAREYERQELRKWALDLAVRSMAQGNSTTSYGTRAEEFINFLKSGS